MSEELKTPTNWPDPKRPGVPMFPERDGWHWLSNKPNETPFPAEWTHEDYSDAETEWFWDMGEEQEEAHEMAGLYYHGPCPFPNKKNIALSNIETLTDRARKNIVAASGARKMAKALSPILDDIDAEVATIRDQNSILTPTQINEMLAAERQRCADACSALGQQEAGKPARQETAYLCAANIRNLGGRAMRAREEQIAELTGVYEDAGVFGRDAKDAAEKDVAEAEERVRAECAADTRRLEWLAQHACYYNAAPDSQGIPDWKDLPGRDFRAAIDAAMEGGNG